MSATRFSSSGTAGLQRFTVRGSRLQRGGGARRTVELTVRIEAKLRGRRPVWAPRSVFTATEGWLDGPKVGLRVVCTQGLLRGRSRTRMLLRVWVWRKSCLHRGGGGGGGGG